SKPCLDPLRAGNVRTGPQRAEDQQSRPGDTDVTALDPPAANASDGCDGAGASPVDEMVDLHGAVAERMVERDETPGRRHGHVAGEREVRHSALRREVVAGHAARTEHL